MECVEVFSVYSTERHIPTGCDKTVLRDAKLVRTIPLNSYYFIKIFKMSRIRKHLGNPVNLTKILVQDNF